jgi:cell division transport system permease protein
MTTDATPEQNDAIRRELERSPDVDRIVYVSQEEAYEEFKTLFGDSPDMVENVSADVLPPSYRVVPTVDDAAAIDVLGQRFEGRAGVKEVVFAQETVDTILKVANTLQVSILVVAGVLLFSAALLIFNTIRMAIFARRREIEVMKLVGATNWFIRVPFMLEGLIQGLVGAGVSFAVIYGLRSAAQDWVRGVQLFESFIVSTGQVTSTGLLVVAIGAAIGTVGAGVAVTRFLDV